MSKLSTLLFVAVASSVTLTAPAFAAAAIDVTAATTAITSDGSAAISAIGGAMLGLAAIAIVFKWAKGAIFG